MAPNDQSADGGQALEEIMASVEKGMAARFEVARAKFENPTEQGTDVEGVLRDFLSEYLPQVYGIGGGEIIDSSGQRSRQIDVVIAGQRHPRTFDHHTPGLFFVEQVLGAGEVKSRLDGEALEDAKTKASSVNNLEKSGVPGLQFTNNSDEVRFYDNTPFFLFAFESALQIETIIDRLQEDTTDEALPNHPLDGVFVLNEGGAINIGDGEGNIKATGPDGTLLEGWVNLDSREVLWPFLAWLTGVLPKTVSLGPTLSRYFFRVGPPPQD